MAVAAPPTSPQAQGGTITYTYWFTGGASPSGWHVASGAELSEARSHDCGPTDQIGTYTYGEERGLYSVECGSRQEAAVVLEGALWASDGDVDIDYWADVWRLVYENESPHCTGRCDINNDNFGTLVYCKDPATGWRSLPDWGGEDHYLEDGEYCESLILYAGRTTSIYKYRLDKIQFTNARVIEIGGWPECATVSDADFDSGTPWTLEDSATVTGSLLTLPGGSSPSFAHQSHLASSTQYTVTLVARASSTATLTVGFSRYEPTLGNMSQSDFVSLSITDTMVQYEFPLPVSGGVNGYLFLLGETTNSIEVDYICLEGAGDIPVCSPTMTTFDLDPGTNLNWSFQDTTSVYGFSQGWRGERYFDNPDEGQRAKWGKVRTGFGILPSSVVAEGLLHSYQWEGAYAAILYDYPYIPFTMTVETIFSANTVDPWLEIWINDGSGWAKVSDDSQLKLLDGDVESLGVIVGFDFAFFVISLPGGYEVKKSALSFTFEDTDAILNPVQIGLVVRDKEDMPPTALRKALGFDSIEIYGCPTGAPGAVGNCVVGDPDLDEYNGEPNPYYWQGGYTGDVPRGGAIIGPNTVLYQSVLPPVPGTYDLQIEYDVDDAVGGCVFNVDVYDYNDWTDPLSQHTVHCEAGPGHETVLPVSLPLSPVDLVFSGIHGTVMIDRVCLVSQVLGTRCLNQNPLFDEGTTGYTGDLYPGGGYATLLQGGRMSALGVEYMRAEPPYVLDLTVSPTVSGTTSTLTVNLGGIPPNDADQVYTVTGQATYTYPFASSVSGGYGPTLWADDGGVRINTYCVTRSTTSGYVPPAQPFTCSTVLNPDFTFNLDYWDANDNVLATNGVASFAADGEIGQTLASFEVATSTVRWLVGAYAQTDATLWVASDYGVYSVTHNLPPGENTFYEESMVISGSTTVSVTAESSGLQLDFICLYPGDTAPPLLPGEEPGTVIIPPGEGALAECVPPPMGILPSTITETLVSLWPWGTSPTYFEILAAYNTAWVRYIGCRLDVLIEWLQDDFWGKPLAIELIRGRCRVPGVSKCGLRAMLDLILAALIFDSLINVINALINSVGLLRDVVDLVKDNVLEVIETIIYLAGVVGLILLAIVGVLLFVALLIALIWLIIQAFGVSFHGAATGSDAIALPLPESEEDPLYNVILGIQLVNQVAGETILFPLVVIAIAIGSAAVLWWTVKQFSVKV